MLAVALFETMFGGKIDQKLSILTILFLKCTSLNMHITYLLIYLHWTF